MAWSDSWELATVVNQSLVISLQSSSLVSPWMDMVYAESFLHWSRPLCYKSTQAVR